MKDLYVRYVRVAYIQRSFRFYFRFSLDFNNFIFLQLFILIEFGFVKLKLFFYLIHIFITDPYSIVSID